MIEIRDTAEGCLLAVRAQPGARKAGIGGDHNGALKVAVTAAPEQGKANKALIELLSKQLGLKKSQIELVSGEASREKMFLLREVKAVDVRARLDELL